mgnify:CR=1 FL=1
MDTGISAQRRTRRQHSKAFKAQILYACDQPDASVAGISIAHGLNPNLVQRWRREARRGQLTLPDTRAFIPVVSTSPSESVTPRNDVPTLAVIEVQLQRGALQARVSWPAQAAGECATWLRELFQ